MEMRNAVDDILELLASSTFYDECRVDALKSYHEIQNKRFCQVQS